MTTVLHGTALSVSFGRVKAVDHVDLAVPAAAIVGLIGPNGAGKTTCIDALTGFVPASGQITLRGADISRLAPHRRARAGLGRTWQSLELFDDLTVRENLLVGAERQSPVGLLGDLVHPRRRGTSVEVDWALDLVGIRDLAERTPSELSHGHRKLVGVARAVAACPTVLCMDEPAAGLDNAESRQLGVRLRAIAASGIAVLLVDHDMGLVLDVCDSVYVLDFGAVVAHGSPAEVARDERVVAAYLGRTPAQPRSPA